jgi:NADPH2:quinone reductase
VQAIVRKAFGGTDQLVIEDVPDPVAGTGEVLVRVRAFGINRAEIYMRRGSWGNVAAISGIECVGEIADDPSNALQAGQRVAAIMGGMGRTRNGSYAELVSVPAGNVIPLETGMDWAHLAAIPECYATAWSCLHENMHMKNGDTVLIRGGTSALGQAAINIATRSGNVTVLATTRNRENDAFLRELGCDLVLHDTGTLGDAVREKYPQGIDSVMDVVGNTTLLDSLKMVKKGGHVCNAGFLGGGEPVPFSPLTDMPPSVNLNFFASFMFGTDGFPLSAVPLQLIVDRSDSGMYRNRPARVFAFPDIARAHALMETNRARGKIVVRL